MQARWRRVLSRRGGPSVRGRILLRKLPGWRLLVRGRWRATNKHSGLRNTACKVRGEDLATTEDPNW